jgi:hypothetical protein
MPETNTEHEAPVTPEAGPRRGLMTGRQYDPVVKKKDLPPVEIKVTLLPHDDDSGPAARRVEPRPVAAEGPRVAGTADADLNIIEKAIKKDDAAERDALAALQRELRATVLKDVKATAQAVAEFQAEHGAFFARTQTALRSGELLVKAGNSSRDRLNRLDRLVGDVVRLFALASTQVYQVEKTINELSIDELQPAMTSAGGGRIHDGFAIPARTKVQRLASGFQREGVLRDLNEKLETSRIIVNELAARITQNEASGVVARGVVILDPAEIQRRKDMSPSRASSGRANNGAVDWNPLTGELEFE